MFAGWILQQLESRPLSLRNGSVYERKGSVYNRLWMQINRPNLTFIHSDLHTSLCVLSHQVVFNSLRPRGLQASLSITISRSLLKFMSIELVMLSNHLILCCPLPLPPSIFPSIRVFSNKSVLCIRWPKYWSLSFSISASNESSGLLSFTID